MDNIFRVRIEELRTGNLWTDTYSFHCPSAPGLNSRRNVVWPAIPVEALEGFHEYQVQCSNVSDTEFRAAQQARKRPPINSEEDFYTKSKWSLNFAPKNIFQPNISNQGGGRGVHLVPISELKNAEEENIRGVKPVPFSELIIKAEKDMIFWREYSKELVILWMKNNNNWSDFLELLPQNRKQKTVIILAFEANHENQYFLEQIPPSWWDIRRSQADSYFEFILQL